MKKGQSVIEYLVIFSILVAISLLLLAKVPGIFQSYVGKATEKMTTNEKE